jgi:multiple sugar transport system permease protein
MKEQMMKRTTSAKIKALDRMPIRGNLPQRAPWYEMNIHWLMLVPAMVILVGLVVYPFLVSLRYSFSNVDLVGGKITQEFIGLDNFRRALRDNTLKVAVGNTATFAFWTVVLEILGGLGIAMVLSSNIRGRRIFVSLFLIPLVMPPIVISLVWKMMYDYGWGVINYLLTAVGLEAVFWLADPQIAMYAIVFADVWHLTPFVMLIFLAGLQSLPTEPYEAARIDGASNWQAFRDITLPLLRPTILLVLLLQTIDGAKLFDKVFVMTGGGPGTATETVTTQIFYNAFRALDIGYAAALSFMLLAVLSVLSTIYIRSMLRKG